MFGKRRKERGRVAKMSRGKSQMGTCVCPHCNYTTTHKRGTPCISLRCPECDVALERQRTTEGTDKNTFSRNKGKGRSLPIIDAELCIGCGACVKKCPADAIVMENGKAKIIAEKCKKCKACVDFCKVNAIT